MAWDTGSMALKIPDTLWSRLVALLLLIALAGLSSGLLVRQLIVRDFRAFISGRLEDRSYWVMARLEGKYAESGRWEPAALADDLVWAYMMGLAVRVSDVHKRPVLDLRQAVELLSPPMKKRVLSYAKGGINGNLGIGNTYPLFHNGEEIGHLEVVCTQPDKDVLFVARSNYLLLFSLLAVGALTILLSVVLARLITRPVERLTAAASSLRDGDMSVRVGSNGTREFKAMAETFNRMADSLADQENLRKKLLTNAAHELRTPLTVMRLQVEQMADGMVPASNRRLTALLNEMDRFRGILGALDDLSQAEASAITLRKEPLPLRSFLEPIVERFALAAQDVAFTLDVPEGITVDADPESLSRIVLNLLGNAVKAVGETGRVAVRATLESEGIVICVEDSGCGISNEDMPHVFERFYHCFTEGMGVGLAIVKELVEAHEGKIAAANNREGGASFRVWLPANS